jgi:DNA-binding NarL/FixJ family response regulator
VAKRTTQTSRIGDSAEQPPRGALPVQRTASCVDITERHPSSLQKQIRVLVVDHETLLRYGIRSVVATASDIEMIGEAATSDEAINQAVRLSPDVLLIESQLPDGTGVAAIRTITQRCPDIRILVLSSRGDLASFNEAATAGAIGYILKDIASENLLAAIRAAFQRRTFLSPTIAQQMVRQFSVEGAVPSNGGYGSSRDVAALNQNHVEVLSRVARGLSDKEIAAQLFLSESAVKSRLRYIYQKLGLKNRAQAVVFALERGFLPSAPGNVQKGGNNIVSNSTQRPVPSRFGKLA